MGDALLWGFVAGSSFVVGGLGFLLRPPRGVALGAIMGVGAGSLISAVSFELVDEAGELAGGSGRVAIGLLGGAVLAVALADGFARSVDRRDDGGADGGVASEVVRLGVAVAAEAVVIVGSLIVGHGVSAAVVAAVFLCGVPEAISSGPVIRSAVPRTGVFVVVWVLLAGWCAVVAGATAALLHDAEARTVAFVLAAAGGVVLTTLTTHLVPRAYRLAGSVVGVPVVLGFALTFGLVELA